MNELDDLLARYKLHKESSASLTDAELLARGVTDATDRTRILALLAAPAETRSAWSGRWKSADRSGDMRCTLTFVHATGRLLGSGADRHGAFRIDGTFTADRVSFLKRYGAHHQVAYEGAYDPAAGTMRGTWFYGVPKPVDEGTFTLQRAGAKG